MMTGDDVELKCHYCMYISLNVIVTIVYDAFACYSRYGWFVAAGESHFGLFRGRSYLYWHYENRYAVSVISA